MASSLRVVLACGFPRDEKLGSARTPLRLERELETLGITVRGIFAEDLPASRGGGRAAAITAPLRMARAVENPARDADVVDIAGGDGALYFAQAKWRRSRPALVARSNGLWDLALAAEDRTARGLLRRTVSDLYQREVPCRFERTAIRQADMAVFLSHCDAREVVRRGWRAANGVAAVNPGVDAFFESSVPLPARRDVAFCGTFFHRKGSDVVVKVMSRVLAARPGLGITLFGAGVTKEHALAQFDAKVRAQVTVAEPMPAAALARALERFSICLFPTRYEGFGIVVLEAMRAGLALVTTATGAGADLIEDGRNGLIVPFGAVDATFAAVTRLLDDDGLRCRIGEAASNTARDRTWRHAAEALIGVYTSALTARSRNVRV